MMVVVAINTASVVAVLPYSYHMQVLIINRKKAGEALEKTGFGGILNFNHMQVLIRNRKKN